LRPLWAELRRYLRYRVARSRGHPAVHFVLRSVAGDVEGVAREADGAAALTPNTLVTWEARRVGIVADLERQVLLQ